VETAFHRGFDAIEDFSCSDYTLRNLLLLQGRNPRTGSGNKGVVTDAPRKIATAAYGKSGIAYAVCLLDKFFYMKFCNHDKVFIFNTMRP
jgi:hypothetical protein